MRTLLVLLLIIGFNVKAQSWIDGQCELISDVKLTDFKDAKNENRLKLVIDQEKKLMADDQDVSFLDNVQRKEYFYNFIMNPDDQDDMAKKPTKAVIRVESYGHKEAKKRLIGQLRDVYYIIWTEAAVDRYDKEYVELDCQKREKVQKKYPYQVIENVEKQKKKDSNKPPTPMTSPSFKGDVKDN
jgi:hypothetical protein